MFTLLISLIVIFSALLIVLILVQNPKGGGLSSNVGGISNQFMGVKQTTDVLEKGTWLFAAIIAILALLSTLFLKGGTSAAPEDSLLQKVNTNSSAPAAPAPAPNPATTADTTKK